MESFEAIIARQREAIRAAQASNNAKTGAARDTAMARQNLLAALRPQVSYEAKVVAQALEHAGIPSRMALDVHQLSGIYRGTAPHSGGMGGLVSPTDRQHRRANRRLADAVGRASTFPVWDMQTGWQHRDYEDSDILEQHGLGKGGIVYKISSGFGDRGVDVIGAEQLDLQNMYETDRLSAIRNGLGNLVARHNLAVNF